MGYDPRYHTGSNESDKAAAQAIRKVSKPTEGARAIPILSMSPETSTPAPKQPRFNCEVEKLE